MAVSEVVDSDDFKTLLRDIYYSEDLKIDSPFANNMKAKLMKYAAQEQITIPCFGSVFP